MSPLRAPVVATAFVDQMKDEAENLRKAKAALESALASGTATEQARKALDDANELYKANSVTIRKHTQPAKPKTKAKAKATAAAQAATSWTWLAKWHFFLWQHRSWSNFMF